MRRESSYGSFKLKIGSWELGVESWNLEGEYCGFM